MKDYSVIETGSPVDACVRCRYRTTEGDHSLCPISSEGYFECIAIETKLSLNSDKRILVYFPKVSEVLSKL